MSPDQVWEMCSVPLISSRSRGRDWGMIPWPSFSQTNLNAHTNTKNNNSLQISVHFKAIIVTIIFKTIYSITDNIKSNTMHFQMWHFSESNRTISGKSIQWDLIGSIWVWFYWGNLGYNVSYPSLLQFSTSKIPFYLTHILEPVRNILEVTINTLAAI